jgi:hypothetical protein
MDDEPENKTQAATERVIKLEEELEASGVAIHDHSALETARAILHKWVDGITATVVSPALGRVTIIHADGRQSTIISPDLPFVLSKPIDQKS